MLNEEEFEEFVVDLKAWPNTFLEIEDGLEIGVGFFATLYFFAGPEDMIGKRMIAFDCLDKFRAMTGDKLKYATHPETEEMHKIDSKRLPDLRERARNKPIDESVIQDYSSEENENSSPECGVQIDVNQYWVEFESPKYSYIRFDFTRTWWREHKQAFLDLYLWAARELQAEQGYLGFGWALPPNLGAQMAPEEIEYKLAQRFYGFDIDKPSWMRSHFKEEKSLEKGLRSPNWGTLVGGRFLKQLGGAVELHKQFTGSRIKLHDLPDAVLIVAGEEPGLYPVEDGIPVLYAKVAKVLKPVRAPTLSLTGFARYDDDPIITFDLNSAQPWLARFDEDGEWPGPAVRKWEPDDGAAQPQALTGRLRAEPNDLVPKTGWWHSTAKPNGKALHYFEAGQHFPDWHTTDYGSVIWGFNPDQQKEPPKK